MATVGVASATAGTAETASVGIVTVAIATGSMTTAIEAGRVTVSAASVTGIASGSLTAAVAMERSRRRAAAEAVVQSVIVQPARGVVVPAGT